MFGFSPVDMRRAALDLGKTVFTAGNRSRQPGENDPVGGGLDHAIHVKQPAITAAQCAAIVDELIALC